jgi:hypothetical protein
VCDYLEWMVSVCSTMIEKNKHSQAKFTTSS